MICSSGPSWLMILISLLAQASSENPVITVVVKDAKLLHPLTQSFEDTNLTKYQWPVVYLELDIGKVCLVSEGQSPVQDPAYYFESKKNPECTQVLCQGPRGPAVEAWTRRVFIKYLSLCVYYVGYGVEEISTANFTKGPLPAGITLTWTVVDYFPVPQMLDISDPDGILDRVLTPEADMVVHISITDQFVNTRLLVTTFSFIWPEGRADTNFCWFLRTISAEWLKAHPIREVIAGSCNYFCPHGMIDGEAWEWEEEDLLDELWRCLGTNLYVSNKTPFWVERDHETDKISIRPRREGGEELREKEKNSENGKRVEL